MRQPNYYYIYIYIYLYFFGGGICTKKTHAQKKTTEKKILQGELWVKNVRQVAKQNLAQPRGEKKISRSEKLPSPRPPPSPKN